MTRDLLDFSTACALVSIVDRGGFSSAAKMMGVTQPAISQKIRKVEREIGKRLFERRGRLQNLTKEGVILYSHAKAFVRLVEDARAELDQSIVLASVKIGIAEDIALAVRQEAVARLFDDAPEVHFEIRVGASCDLIELFDSGRLDLIVAKEVAPSVRGEALWQEDHRWYGSTAMPSPERFPVPLVLHAAPCMLRDVALKVLREAGVKGTARLETNDVKLYAAALDSGLGYGLAEPTSLPRDILCDLREAPGLPRVPRIDCFISHPPPIDGNRHLPGVRDVLRSALVEAKQAHRQPV